MRVLLVSDVPQWAWHRMFLGVQKFAPPEYEVTVCCQTQFGQRYHAGKLNFDAICQASWTEATLKPLPGLQSTLLASHGAEYDWPHNHTNWKAMIATRLRNRVTAQERLPYFDTVLCVSPALLEVATMRTARGVYCHPGVDTEMFTPAPTRNEKLRIGWCGQKPEPHQDNTKGYNTILKPLMRRLKDYRFDWNINGRTAADALSWDEMIQWHQSNDVFISTSCSEGCQMPTLEAMACGVPMLGTISGTLGIDVLDGETGYLCGEYHDHDTSRECVERIALRLIELNKERELLRLMGEAARERTVEEFSWKRRAPEWLEAICMPRADDTPESSESEPPE